MRRQDPGRQFDEEIRRIAVRHRRRYVRRLRIAAVILGALLGATGIGYQVVRDYMVWTRCT